jgi:hypothetical protein
MINNQADAMLHISLYMQRWRVLVRPKDRRLLDEAMVEVRRLRTRMRDDS